MNDERRELPRARPLAAFVVLLGLCAALFGYVATRFSVNNDISYFLPEGGRADTARVLKQLAGSALGQRMVLVLSGAEPAALAAASKQLAQRLARHPEIARVQGGLDSDEQRHVFELYYPRRFALFSEEPERAYAALTSEAGLRRAASKLLAGLSGVASPFVRRLAEGDPLGCFDEVVARLQAARQGTLQLRDGAFFSSDGLSAVLFVSTKHSALATDTQGPVLAAIDRELAELRRSTGLPLALAQSGVNRYALAAEQSVKHDVQRISAASTVGLLVLFLVLFGSLRSLWLTVLPPLVGALVATAVTLALFGRLHGATLAFGATLIGVCVDYPVHLLAHHTLGPKERIGSATLRAIRPALLLGSATTIAGLFAFGWASFPGIREIACFTSVGALSALLVTLFALPQWLGPSGQAPKLQRAIAGWLGRLTLALRARQGLCAGVLLGAIALCIAGLPRLRFQDDLANWVPAPPALRAEDERVRALIGAPDAGRLVLVSAGDAEQALQANDRVAAAMNAAAAAGELGGFQSLHAFGWSQALQQRNLSAAPKASALRPSFERVYGEAGFAEGAFAPFFSALEQPAELLRVETLLQSPLGSVASVFVLEQRPTPTLATYLRSVRDGAAIERRLTAIPGARYLDQRELLRSTYAAFRSRALELIGLGLFGVLAMVWARHRALRPTLAAVVPAILAAGGSLAVLTLCGVTIDLFHIVGLLLVLSMGEDYGVFLVESRDAESVPATMLGLLLACISTVLSFGLLAMSTIPALRSLGQVISVGITLALLWAPAGLALLEREAR